MTPSHHSGDQRLFQTVILLAVLDATNPTPADREARDAKRQADYWLRHAPNDFRFICALAGQDPDFVSEAYIAGRIDRNALRVAAEKRGIEV